ncbi:MAG: InlB B-repeat-containing protein [Defluviitaleaceae bacterium]|nr:InlB B-repeat-containing protein [Defluviitaleaceae bacterium]
MKKCKSKAVKSLLALFFAIILAVNPLSALSVPVDDLTSHEIMADNSTNEDDYTSGPEVEAAPTTPDEGEPSDDEESDEAHYPNDEDEPEHPLLDDVELALRAAALPLSDLFTVTFDGNSTVATTLPGQGVRGVTVAGDSLGNLPIPPSREDGHVFMSWNTLPNGEGTVFDENTPVTGTITVFAQWGWRIEFLLGGAPSASFPGIGTAPGHANNDQNSTSNFGIRHIYAVPGSTINSIVGVEWPVVPANANPGYTFEGWFRVGETTNPVDGDTIVTGSMSLVALWNRIGNPIVTFDATRGNIPANHTATREAIAGMSISASWATPYYLNRDPGLLFQRTAPQASYTNAVLQGWWTQPHGSGTRFAPPGRAEVNFNQTFNSAVGHSTVDVNDSMTVYAHWVHRITFLPNGGNWQNASLHPNLANAGTAAQATGHRVRDIRIYDTSGNNISGTRTLRTHAQNPPIMLNVSAGPQASIAGVGARPYNIPLPTRSGYIFAGWEIRENPTKNVFLIPTGGGTLVPGIHMCSAVADMPITGNLMLTAQWTPGDQYVEVTFDANGGLVGGQPTETRRVADGNSMAISTPPTPTASRMPEAPVRPGFVFMGWYTTPLTNQPSTGDRLIGATIIYNVNSPIGTLHGGSIQATHDPTDITGNRSLLTVYARWVPLVTVTLDGNNGTISSSPNTTRTLPADYASGHTAQIWRNTLLQNEPAIVTSNIDLPNNVVRAGFTPLRISQGVTHVTPFGMNQTSARIHTIFNTQSDGAGDTFGRNSTVDIDTTLYATWTGVVTFNNNHNSFMPALSNNIAVRQVISGTSVGSNTLSDRLNNVHYHYPVPGATATVTIDGTALVTFGNLPLQRQMPSQENWGQFQLPGWAFIGWFENADPNNRGAEFDVNSEVQGNRTVFAHWSDELVFDLGAAPEQPGWPQMVSSNVGPAVTFANQGLPVPVAPAWTGRVFREWNTQADGNGLEFGTTTPVLQWWRLTAIWDVPVTFHSQAGQFSGGVPNSFFIHHAAGRPTSEPLFFDVTRTNWDFHSWNTVANGSGDVFLLETPLYGSDAGAMNLFAQFSGNVSFNLNDSAAVYGVSGAVPADVTLLEGRSVNTTTGTALPNPNLITRAGYVFGGWNTAPDGSGTMFTANTIMENGHMTVYAIWLSDPYILTIVNHPTTLSPIGQTESGPRNLGTALNLASGTASGWVFRGWTTDSVGWATATANNYTWEQAVAAGLVTAPPANMPNSDLTVIAVWDAVSGGSGPPEEEPDQPEEPSGPGPGNPYTPGPPEDNGDDEDDTEEDEEDEEDEDDVNIDNDIMDDDDNTVVTEPPTTPPSDDGSDASPTPDGTEPEVAPIPTSPDHTLVQYGDMWIEFDESGVPLGAWVWDDEQEMWIFDDGNVPLGALNPATAPVGLMPQTGITGFSTQLGMFFALTLAVAVVTIVLLKKESLKNK